MFNNQWGPHGWIFLHSITFQYPMNPSINDKKNYYNFFHSLQYILPCPKCKNHYSDHLKNNPIQLNSRLDLIHWLIKVHNNVNKSLNKKIYSFNEIENLYHKNYNYSIQNNINSNNNNTYHYLLIILILLFIFYIKL